MAKKKQTRDTRLRHGGFDPFEVQIAVRYPRTKKLQPSASVLEKAVRIWAETGNAPKGFDVQVTRWRNPSRKNVSDRKWRVASTEKEKQCALVKRFLRTGRTIRFSTVGVSR